MSSKRQRERDDGTVYFSVLYREDGKQRSRSFNDEATADRYRRVLDIAGDAAAFAAVTAPVAGRSDYSVTEWVEHFIEHNSKTTAGTKAEYIRVWRRTFGPLIGQLPLDVLTRDMVSGAVMSLADRLAYKTVLNARNLLATALESAVEDEHLIPSNPTRRVSIPRVNADEIDRARFLTHDEWARVVVEIPDHWKPIFLFLVGTGCRVNEATAVQVKDVNLDELTVRIVRAWKRDPKEGKKLGAPKTAASRRTVDLDPAFGPLLAPLLAGKPRDALLFTGRTGRKVSDGNLRERVWHLACIRAGLAVVAPDDRPGHRRWLVPPPRVHDLRHTSVSWAIAAGARMDVVQERLGHKDIRTTMGTYHHLEQGAQRVAARSAAAAFAPLLPALPELGQ